MINLKLTTNLFGQFGAELNPSSTDHTLLPPPVQVLPLIQNYKAVVLRGLRPNTDKFRN